MRLFLAIPLPTPVRRALTRTQRDLIARGATGRFVPEENFHITLHFIGEHEDVYGLSRAMHLAVRDAKPLSLRLGEYGFFAAGGGRTGYLSLTGDLAELNRLFETLETALVENGFPRGKGRFLPHVTLARNMLVPAGVLVRCEAVPFTANELVLYESLSKNGRMVYTPLHRETLL